MEALLIVKPKDPPRLGLLVLHGTNRLTSEQMRKRLLKRVTTRLQGAELDLWTCNIGDDLIMVQNPSRSLEWSKVAEAFTKELALGVRLVTPSPASWKRFEILASSGNRVFTISEVIWMIAFEPKS